VLPVYLFGLSGYCFFSFSSRPPRPSFIRGSPEGRRRRDLVFGGSISLRHCQGARGGIRLWGPNGGAHTFTGAEGVWAGGVTSVFP